MRTLAAAAFALVVLSSGCGSDCSGIRCDTSRVVVTVNTARPGAFVTATFAGSEIPCAEAGAESSAGWFCYLTPTEAGTVDVLISDGERMATVPVEVAMLETSCCGTLLQGNAMVELDSDAGA